MLRAHMPKTFETPGSGQPLVQGDGNSVLVIGEKERDALVALRQESLDRIAERKAQAKLIEGTL
jgi:hypothetical protein